MYKEGRSIVKEVVSDVKGVVKDVKDVQKDVQGIFGFLSSIFGSKPKINEKNAENVQKVAPKATGSKNKAEPEFDESAIFSQVGQSLMDFFKARNALAMFISEEEEKTRHVIDNLDEANDIAIKLTLANLQMEQMNVDLREYMIYHVPPEMKNLYSRVNEMLEEVANQQAVARQEELVRKRNDEWRRKQVEDQIKDQFLTITVTLVIIMWGWGLVIALTHTPQY